MDVREAELGENLLKSLEPLPAALLEAIETLQQTSDPSVVKLGCSGGRGKRTSNNDIA
jgi:hypothetical protein